MSSSAGDSLDLLPPNESSLLKQLLLDITAPGNAVKNQGQFAFTPTPTVPLGGQNYAAFKRQLPSTSSSFWDPPHPTIQRPPASPSFAATKTIRKRPSPSSSSSSSFPDPKTTIQQQEQLGRRLVPPVADYSEIQSARVAAQSASGQRMNEALKDAFTATVGRDYEKAVTVIRAAVATSPEPFGAEDLELMDHVYSCILNTSHYDETVMDVCWEWIDAIERLPRIRDPRVVASSQLSIYYAYHTICRVQERIPRKNNHQQMRNETWKRCNNSFQYLWGAATQFWKPADLDRLDVLVSWSYLCLQFSDVCDEATMTIIEEAKDHSAHVLNTTIVVENSHQAAQRVNTVSRNLRDTRALAEKLGRTAVTVDSNSNLSSSSDVGSPEEVPPNKKAREE